MAAVWKTPVVFIITNNLYGEYSPQMTTTSTVDLARRADPHGMPGIVVDGQDVDVVNQVVSEALERARGGGGPQPAGDEDLPLSRSLAHRPGQVPGAGRAGALEGAGPHHHPGRQARRRGPALGRGAGSHPRHRSRRTSMPPPSEPPRLPP